MPSLYDRIARRLEEGRDYYDDFQSDLEAGRRNQFGLKTQLWYNHQEELRRRRRERRHRRRDRTHRNDTDKEHDRDHPNDKNAGHDQAHSQEIEGAYSLSRHHSDKYRGHVHNKRDDDGERRPGGGNVEDQGRKHRPSHHNRSSGTRASGDGAERRGESSKASNVAHPHLRVRDVIVDVAGKVLENLLGGSTKQPENENEHRRRHYSRKTDEGGADYGDRHHGHHGHQTRTPERIPAKPERQHHGAPRLPHNSSTSQQLQYVREDRRQPRTQNGVSSETNEPRYGAPHRTSQGYGEAKDYYQDHPLKHVQPSKDRAQGPPSRRPPHDRQYQGQYLTPKQHSSSLQLSQGSRSVEGPLNGKKRHPKQTQDGQSEPEPGPRENRLRPPKTKAKSRDLDDELLGGAQGVHDFQPQSQKHSRSSREPEAAVPETSPSVPFQVSFDNPSTTSVKDFGRSQKNRMSPQETATTTSINEDPDGDNDTDSSSIDSRHSSLVAEQPAKSHGKHSRDGMLERAEGYHRKGPEVSEDAHSDEEDMHIRGGGRYDYYTDDDSDAQYSEYEKFDDEYLGDAHILGGGNAYIAQQTRIVPPMQKQAVYSPLSYANERSKSGGQTSFSYADARPKSRADHSSSNDDAKLGSRGYGPLSYAAAKATAITTNKDQILYTISKPKQSETHSNLSNSFYRHCGRSGEASTHPLFKGIPASTRNPSHSCDKVPKTEHSKHEYTHSPLGKTPRPYDASSDNQSERSLSPEPSKSNKKSGNSRGYNHDQEQYRMPEPPEPKSKHARFSSNFQHRSRSPPRPKRSYKSKPPASEQKRDVPGPIEEPPLNHYATLEISPSASPKTFVSFLSSNLSVADVRNRIAILAKKMRIKVHPDMLKRKNPGMSDREKTAIDEYAQRVGEAAEILLDSDKVCFPSHLGVSGQ